MGDAPTAEAKALAIARLEAMRGTLECVDNSNWRLIVRRVSAGGAIKLMSEDLDGVHQEWVPGYVEHRRSVYERASRFNVAEVTASPEGFGGVVRRVPVPEVRARVAAHAEGDRSTPSSTQCPTWWDPGAARALVPACPQHRGHARRR
jgi:hypothetical protein